jgi:hypothetical protein
MACCRRRSPAQAPGEIKTVTVTLSTADLSIYSVVHGDWMPVSGKFTVFVGASATDIKLTGAFNV